MDIAKCLEKLSASQIAGLIQFGVINAEEDIVSAYDIISYKIVFDEDLIDPEYYEKLAAVVNAIKVTIFSTIV